MSRGTPRPACLSEAHWARFDDPSVVAAYRHRPPYPDELFGILRERAVGERPRVLDLGCGTGKVARRVLEFAGRVDAVDASPRAIEHGRTLAGGDDARLRWIVGRTETAPLDPPYDLVTAGASLHWMDWDTLLPRLSSIRSPGAVLAYFDDRQLPAPWEETMRATIARLSTNRDYVPVDLTEQLVARGLFRVLGRKKTAPVSFMQPVEEYLEAMHSWNGLSRDALSPEACAAFDAEVGAAVSEHSAGGLVRVWLESDVVWGDPLP